MNCIRLVSTVLLNGHNCKAFWEKQPAASAASYTVANYTQLSWAKASDDDMQLVQKNPMLDSMIGKQIIMLTQVKDMSNTTNIIRKSQTSLC